VRKCYLISLIGVTILIVLVGIMLGLSFLNFGNKEVYKANFFQKEIIKKAHDDLIDDEIENEKSNETVIETKPENTEKNIEKIENIEITDEIKNQINDVINSQLYVLWNKHSISEIENGEKVQVAFELYKKAKNVKYLDEPEIDASLIENYYSQSLISELPFYHESLKTHIFISYVQNRDSKEYRYDYIYNHNNQSYVNNPGGCDLDVVMPASQKIVGLFKKNNQIILQMKYIWINHPDVGPITELYKSYEDAKSMKNEIWKTDYDGFTGITLESYEEYIENNNESLYSIMETYNYIFELKNNEYKLVNFYRN